MFWSNRIHESLRYLILIKELYVIELTDFESIALNKLYSLFVLNKVKYYL